MAEQEKVGYRWRIWPVVEAGRREWRFLIHLPEGKCSPGKRRTRRGAERAAKKEARRYQREDERNAQHLSQAVNENG